MTPSRIRARLARRPQGDDGVALMTVLFVLLVASGLAISLTGVVLSQTLPAMYEKKSTRSLHSSEAGIDYTLSRLRDSRGVPREIAQLDGTVTTIDGDQTALPCTPSLGGPGAPGPNWQQSLDLGAAGRTDVTITYFLNDPSGKDAAWRQANKMACATTIDSPAPLFALITSTSRSTEAVGTSTSAGNRALEAVYNFRVTNVRIAGGRLQFDGVDAACLDAGGTDPDSGDKVEIAGCGDRYVFGGQQWTYDPLNRLVVFGQRDKDDDDDEDDDASDDEGRRPGLVKLCLTATNNDGVQAKIKKCRTPVPVTQIWNVNDSRRFEGTASATSKSGRCLVEDSTARIVLGSCRAPADKSVFAPEPTVGAGSANATSNYMVNFDQFGYCLDVTNFNTEWDYMIQYPCKVDPGGRPWNHQWYRNPDNGLDPQLSPNPFTGQLYTKKYRNTNGTGDFVGNYCLTTRDAVAVSGEFPVLRLCSDSDPKQRWSYTGKQPNYSESYLTRPTSNPALCLDYSRTEFHSQRVPKIVLAPCDGSDGQKWNAPPQEKKAGLTNQRETPAR